MVPGGVVAMDRHYFQNTGAYDPLMSLWGGENLELSLKVCPVPRADPGTTMRGHRLEAANRNATDWG